MAQNVEMADVVVFSSGSTGSKRLALVLDDVNSNARIEIRNAANDLTVNTGTMSASTVKKIVGMWKIGDDRTVQLKATNPQLLVSFLSGKTSSWTTEPADDSNTASEEIVLDAGQTGVVVAWLEFGFTAA